MKNKRLILTSTLALVLVCGAFLSLAAAQDERVPDPAAPPDACDNPTTTEGADILYAAEDNRTLADDSQATGDVPDAENPNLIAAQTGTDNTLTIAAIATAAAVAAGAVGFLVYRRSSKKTKN